MYFQHDFKAGQWPKNAEISDSQQILAIICSMAEWVQLNHIESGVSWNRYNLPHQLFSLCTQILAVKLVFFLIKIFLPPIYKYKHTFSPRTNENVGQQCNSNILRIFQNGAKYMRKTNGGHVGKAMDVVKQDNGINHVTLLRAFKQPSSKVGYAQPCCHNVIWADPTSYL